MIETRPRARSRLRWFALVGVCVALLMSAASAQAHAGGVYNELAQRQGMIAQAPSHARIDRTLKQRTGYDASRVVAENVCPAPAQPGKAQCAAQVLVTRSGHHRIHPGAGPRQRPEQTRSAHMAAVGTPAGQSQPTAYSPGYLQQAYDLSWLSANRGTGDTVAIVDAGYDAGASEDYWQFLHHNGLTSCPEPTSVTSGLDPAVAGDPCLNLQQVNQNGSSAVSEMPPDDGWALETALDIDAVASICPNCHILLVEANSAFTTDLSAANQLAASTPGVGQISNSWSVATTSPSEGTFTFPGVLTVAAAGDDGYATGVNAYPAALPGVVAAGGTTLAASSAPTGRGFGESVWNAVSENESNQTAQATGSGCDTDEAKPAFQSDVGCAGRAYNDISADADVLTGLLVYQGGQWYLAGGTSLSSPLVAAYAALIGQTSDSPAWAYTDAGDLFDPTTGNNELTSQCSALISYICDAGLGYDGPTGNGSISGTVVTGAPGIGAGGVQSVSDSSAAVLSGVFANGLQTTYYWQYGLCSNQTDATSCPTSPYPQQTAPADVGQGQGVVETSSTLTGLTAGSLFHYRLVATNADGTVYGYDQYASTTAAPATAPVNTSAPQVTGAAVVGQTLSASAGQWSPAPGSVSYQWQRSADGSTWTSIAGQTGPGYTVAAADLGDYLQVQVTATNNAGQNTQTSAQTAQVTTLVPWSTASPQITGSALEGQTLTTSTGQWTPAASEGYVYQWQRSADGSSWTDIAGATAAAYTLQDADVSNSVRVQVTAFDSYGASLPQSSVPTATIIFTPDNTSLPTVTGTMQRLDTLTAGAGQWSFASSYTYQWQELNVAAGGGWEPIPGATGATYTLVSADEGNEVRVQVTATNANGSTIAASADPVDSVAANPPYTPTDPTIQGPALVGQPLTIANGTFAPSDAGPVAYQWQRSTDGTTWTDITGQTSATFTPTSADAGDQLQVQLSSTNVDGTAVVYTNALTVPVGAPPAPVAQQPPTIIGTALVGVELQAHGGTWNNTPHTTYGFQWSLCNNSGTGCSVASTGNTFQVTGDDAGDDVVVAQIATYADGIMTSKSALFGPIAAVISKPPPSSTPPASTPPPASTEPAPIALRDPTLSGRTATVKITKTGSKPVKTGVGKRLATAKLSAVKHTTERKLVLTRAAGLSGTMTGWACQSTGKQRCVAKKTSHGAETWTTTLIGPLRISVTTG